MKDKLSCLDSETLSKVASLMDNLSNANKEIASLKDKIASASAKNLSSGMEEVNGVSFLAKTLEKGERNDLLSLADNLKEGKKDYYLLLAGKGSKGISLVIMAGGEGAKRLGAGAGMKLVAPLLNGNGGGKPEMASGSAKDLSAFEEAADMLKKHL